MKKVLMFCPGCYCVLETEEEADIVAYQTKDDNVFNTANQEAYDDCKCDEDYIYVEEVNVLDVLKLIASKGYSF
jgi:hypothetical protein